MRIKALIIKYLKHLLQVNAIASKRLFYDNYTYRASALAYTTLLSIVPFITVGIFVIALFPVFNIIVLLTKNYILANFIPASAESIEVYFNNFVTSASQLPSLSFIFLFITAYMMMDTIEDTLNDIWRIRRRHKAWILLLIGLILLLVPLVVSLGTLVSYLFLASEGTNYGISKVVLYLLPLIVNTLIFSLLYIILPHVQVRWRDGLLGGFVAALLFDLCRFIFAYYMEKYPSYELIYGSFAAFPIFLLWLYVCWLIVLYGAIVAHTQGRIYKIHRSHKAALIKN